VLVPVPWPCPRRFAAAAPGLTVLLSEQEEADVTSRLARIAAQVATAVDKERARLTAAAAKAVPGKPGPLVDIDAALARVKMTGALEALPTALHPVLLGKPYVID
jgi:hypothetical protein